MTIINSQGSDKKVKVSQLDNKSDYLENKIIAGPNVTVTKVSVAGVEHLEISADADANDPDVVGLHYVKCREENGCVIHLEVRPIHNQTLCFIKKVAC